MGPLRELLKERNGNLTTVTKQELEPITALHFQLALDAVKPSVSQKDLQRYIEWNRTFGSYRFPSDDQMDTTV